MVITAEHDQALARARHRAEARNLVAIEASRVASGHDRTYFFRVSSFSRQGTEHGVRVNYSADGVEVICSCEGGLNNRLCQHAAAALQALESPQVEPEPPAAINRGAAALAILNGDPDDYIFMRSA